MSYEDRLESTSDALFHIKELIDSLKQLGINYANHIDVLDDIRRELEIDESVTERELTKQYEKELRLMNHEYYQMI